MSPFSIRGTAWSAGPSGTTASTRTASCVLSEMKNDNDELVENGKKMIKNT
jgi:hypothetical protein